MKASSKERLKMEDLESVKDNPKSADFLKNQLRRSALLNRVQEACVEAIIDKVLNVMFKKVMSKGDILMREGDQGDAMFIVEKGDLDIYHGTHPDDARGGDENFYDSIARAKRGDPIGVNALLYNVPRTATLRAINHVVVWGLGKHEFRQCRAWIADWEKENSKRIAESLCKLFPQFNQYEKHMVSNLSSAFEQVKFSEGDIVFEACREEDGEFDDNFYIIEEGTIEIKRKVLAPQPVYSSVPDLGFELGALQFGVSDEDDGVEPLNLTLGGSFDDDADAPKLSFENAPTLEDDYGGGSTLEDDSAAGFITSSFDTPSSGRQMNVRKIPNRTNSLTPSNTGYESHWETFAPTLTTIQSSGEVQEEEGGFGPMSLGLGGLGMSDSDELVEQDPFGSQQTEGMKFYWSRQLNEVCPNDTSLTIDTITAMTDVVLYRLPSSDVRYLIFPVFKTEDDSDDFEEDFTERWIPELEVEDPADLRTIGILGIGNFGAVSLIQDPNTEKTYACKKMFKDRIIESNHQRRVVLEKQVMQSISSPFVVKLCATCQTKDAVFLIMEVALGGELFTLLRKEQKLPEDHAKFYAANVVLALDALHSKDFLYRDLKPENLVFNDKGYLKLTDFGFTKKRNTSMTLCGTPQYLAPEIIRMWSQSFGVDWWALGILVFEMIFGHPPFRDDEVSVAHVKILDEPVPFPPNSTISSKAFTLIDRLLQKIPYRRLGHNGAAEVKEHEFFSDIDWSQLESQVLVPPRVPLLKNSLDLSCFEGHDSNFHEEQYSSSSQPAEAYSWAEDF